MSSFTPGAWGARNLVECGDGFQWKFQSRGREIFAEMADRRCAGNEQNIGSALKQPCKRDLHRRRLHGCRSRVKRCRLERRESSEREVGHIGNALGLQIIDERVIATLREVIQVLDADNFRDRLRLGQLLRRHGAETDMLNEPLLLEFSERGEWLFKWLVFRSGEPAEPEIHDLERIETQVAQIVVYGVDDLLRASVREARSHRRRGAHPLWSR